MLLGAGADLSESHLHGHSALWHMCTQNSMAQLQKLATAGWLESAELSAPLGRARQLLTATPVDYERRQIVALLSAQRRLWPMVTRPAVVVAIAAHDQLVPEMAELIASDSYLDHDKTQSAAASAAATAQP